MSIRSNNEMDATQTHRDLIERCREGRRDAQFELYRLYSKAMYNTALRMVQNPHDAEDLLQSIFIEVFSKLDTFRYESSVGAWIKRITVNKCINFLKSRRLAFSELTSYNDRAEEQGPDPEPLYSVERINRAIGELPDGYRVVFSLYAVEGYDHEEIAQVLGITEATSKSQYSRAKAKLRDMLTENGGRRSA
ncbi:MAG: RNA polymerase sigma factor [Haliscomenobacteraceae bacterium CHB4]|nr:RNA polymerase sigma factor [Haliscomenobacteraceae bacterium CHB4]